MDDLIAQIRAELQTAQNHAEKDLDWISKATSEGDWTAQIGFNIDYSEVALSADHDAVIVRTYGLNHAADAQVIARAVKLMKRRAESVLRQVAAHRKILELHRIEFFPPKLNVYTGLMEWPHGRWYCPVCSERRDGVEQLADGQACPTVLALAEAYGIEP